MLADFLWHVRDCIYLNLILPIRFLISPLVSSFLWRSSLFLLVIPPGVFVEFAGSEACNGNIRDGGLPFTALRGAVKGFHTFFWHPKGTFRLDNEYHCLIGSTTRFGWGISRTFCQKFLSKANILARSSGFTQEFPNQILC